MALPMRTSVPFAAMLRMSEVRSSFVNVISNTGSIAFTFIIAMIMVLVSCTVCYCYYYDRSVSKRTMSAEPQNLTPDVHRKPSENATPWSENQADMRVVAA